MSATTEDPEALRFDSHGGGSRNAPFCVYRQTPARRAAASNAVPFVRLRHLPWPTSRISGNDDDLSRLVDFNPGDMHTGRGDGFDRSGHVLLDDALLHEISPRLRAAACRFFVVNSARFGLVGLTSRPTTVAAGTSSCSSSSRFGCTSAFSDVTPVMLPPGRARLVTSPIATGSDATSKTIGIVVVAALAASAAGVLPGATITVT